MFIDKNSVKINNVSMGPYLLSAKYGYNKLWANDTGRNLAGEMSGTLIGIYPKITLHFRKLNENEMTTISRLIDTAWQSLTYYDPNKATNITITTYTNDWEYESKRVGKASDFSVALIAKNRRS